MEKIDLKRQWKDLYQPSAKTVATVVVPAMNFLIIDGMGDPNTSPEFHQALEALYSVSYTLKFLIRATREIDYAVMPLEGLWWMEDMTRFSPANKSEWLYRIMIMQPDFIIPDEVEAAIAKTAGKKDLPALPRLQFERFDEGLAAQIMHIGPFSEEKPTIEKLHRYIEESGHARDGKHHEIYLTDMRRTAPERWKTVIRQPMR